MSMMSPVSGFLQRAQQFFAAAGAIRPVRKRSITNGERQLQRLKAQIDELSQRLRTIEAIDGAVGVELSGPGPFRLARVTQLKALVTELEHQLVTRLELHGGKEVYARIPYLCAAQLVNGDFSLPLPNHTLCAAKAINAEPQTHALRLPLLSRYAGHFYADHDTRVMVFLTLEGQRIFFPVFADTYEKLRRQFEAALIPYEWP